MQKLNPSLDDVKTILYHHLWELKFCLSFVGTLFHFLRERKYFYPRTFFLSHLSAPFLFSSVTHQTTGKHANMKQADKTYL